MCSIGGWLSSEPLPRADATRLTQALLWYGADRGQQSAGVYSNGRVVKRALPPAKVIRIRAFSDLMAEPTTLVLTHTRQPTCGGLGDRQAQPFQHGEITTVHNGHISNMKEVAARFGITKPSGVDSELFCTYAAQHGVLDMPQFFDAVKGSMAVAAVVGGTELYLIREGNPIEWDTIKVGGVEVFVFGSTSWQVHNAMRSVWLMGYSTTKSVPFGDLFRAAPGGTTLVADRVRPPMGFTPAPTPTYSARGPASAEAWTTKWRDFAWDSARRAYVNAEGLTWTEYLDAERIKKGRDGLGM